MREVMSKRLSIVAIFAMTCAFLIATGTATASATAVPAARAVPAAASAAPSDGVAEVTPAVAGGVKPARGMMLGFRETRRLGAAATAEVSLLVSFLPAPVRALGEALADGLHHR
jgi:hypothetical protein